MSGPPKTPTRISELRGNPGKRPRNKREPKPKTGRPPVSSMVLDNKVAHEEWEQLCRETENNQVLTPGDRGIMNACALAWAEYVDASNQISATGITYETTNTTGDRVIKAHPAVAIRSDAWRRYKSALLELGLTPATRMKVSTVESEESADQAESYFN